MNPAAPPLPSSPSPAPAKRPLPAAQPLDANALLERIYRGQGHQTEVLRGIRTRLTWIAIFTGLPYVFALLSFLGWLILMVVLAAGVATATGAAMEGARQEAERRGREVERRESAPPRFAPPAVDRDGYADPEFPENAAEILRESGF